MKSNDLDAGSLSRMKKRKRGEIARHVRDPRSLSQAQAKLAHDLAERYGLEYRGGNIAVQVSKEAEQCSRSIGRGFCPHCGV